ncbi:MAG: cytochrome P450, partial [Acidimicrobiia bacterium]
MTDAPTLDVDALLAEILLTPEGKADPYPRYAAIREHAPAFRSAIGMVVVARYDDCQWVLRDPRFGKGGNFTPWERYELTREEWLDRFPDFEARNQSMLGLDPPDHTRLRRLVAKAFTPKTVENLRPDILRLTNELLDRIDGTVDVIAELALKLPIAV